LQRNISSLNVLNFTDIDNVQFNKSNKINDDNIFIYHDTSMSNKKQKLNNNDSNNNNDDNNNNNMIKNVLEDIILFNSLNEKNINNDSNNSNFKNDIIVNIKEIDNQYEELILSCKVHHTQIIKYKATGSSKFKVIITNIISIIDEISKIENLTKKLHAIYTLGLWQSEEEILLNIAEYYQNNEHIVTTAISIFIAILLVKARTLKAPATRTFLRIIELTIKCKDDLTISGLLSRIIQVPNHVNSFSNTCPISLINRVINESINDKRLNTIPGNFQFELFQRSARQLLSKQQKDILLFNTFNNSNANKTDFELIKLIDGVISPLALLIDNENLNIHNIFDEWKKLIELNQIILSNLPSSNNSIIWDNDNLKVLNSVLTGCSDLSITTIRCMLMNLDDISIGGVILCSSINLAALMHTITTRYISIIKSHDDLSRLVKGILMRLSNIMAKNALTAFEKYV